jgi:hypothetical protein
MCYPSARVVPRCGLTPRSSRRATAAKSWPLQAIVVIVLPRPSLVCLRARLSSNVGQPLCKRSGNSRQRDVSPTSHASSPPVRGNSLAQSLRFCQVGSRARSVARHRWWSAKLVSAAVLPIASDAAAVHPFIRSLSAELAFPLPTSQIQARSHRCGRSADRCVQRGCHRQAWASGSRATSLPNPSLESGRREARRFARVSFRFIIAHPGKTACLAAPLSSHVRPRKPHQCTPSGPYQPQTL